jgi:uncharacterized membrane protein
MWIMNLTNYNPQLMDSIVKGQRDRLIQAADNERLLRTAFPRKQEEIESPRQKVRLVSKRRLAYVGALIISISVLIAQAVSAAGAGGGGAGRFLYM